MKIAVVGHIEWGSFVRVDHAPKDGEIVHATESWEEAAGGGSVAAMQLALLNGSCVFFTAVGDDERGHKAIDQLRLNGVEVYASVRSSQATNLAFVHVDTQGERTITVSGDLKPDTSSGVLPWDRLYP